MCCSFMSPPRATYRGSRGSASADYPTGTACRRFWSRLQQEQTMAKIDGEAEALKDGIAKIASDAPRPKCAGPIAWNMRRRL